MPKSLATGGKLHKYNLTDLARGLRNRFENKLRLKSPSRKPSLPKAVATAGKREKNPHRKKDENHEHI
jgi:hypothetical protein